MVEPWILYILALVSCLAGFCWLALAMEPHWKKVLGRSSKPPAQILRLLGSLGLLLSGVLCFIADRPSMAALVWLMLLAASVPGVGMILAWRPRLLRVFWIK
jgi:hypothetical protein